MPDWSTMSDEDLGNALTDAADHFAYPPTPTMLAEVRSRIDARGRRSWLFGPYPMRRVPLYAAAMLVVALLVAAANPTVRSAAAHFFHIQGVVVNRVPSRLPSPSPYQLASPPVLPTPATLGEARVAAQFAVLVPAQLGYPDRVLLDSSVPGNVVTLVYHARPGIPRESESGEGVIVTEFRGDLNPQYLTKDAGAGTTVEQVTVNGVDAYWISGTPHQLVFVDPNGNPMPAVSRMAANTLVWSKGSVTYRIESRLTLAQSTLIAQSMQ